MGPRHKQASHACKPFFISVNPSPLPTPHGHGHGSCGTFTFGLEGLQLRPAVFAFPPPFFPRRLVPCALWVQHYRDPPVFRQPTAHTGADAPSWCRSVAPGPPSGFPLQVSLPFIQPHHPILSAAIKWQLGSPGHAYWVQSVHWDSGTSGKPSHHN